MKKYILFFVAASLFGISHSFAQSQAITGRGETAVVTDSVRSSGNNNSHGTISKAGKNEQSIYTPAPTDAGNSPASPATPAAQQSSAEKGQPATLIDPKKRY